MFISKLLFKKKKVEVPVPKPKFNFHFDLKLTWTTVFQIIITLFALSFLILIHPIPQRGSKYLVIASIGIMWLLLMLKLWKNFLTRAASVVVTLIIIFTIASTGKSVDIADINKRYIQVLHNYVGTGYLLGGENSIGIDSSGLIRRPMIDALMQIGYESKNMKYYRDAIDIWLDDYNIKNIYANYNNLFYDVQKFEDLTQIDKSKLMNGDILIYDDYVQTYIYTGNDNWIQVNPEEKKVISTHVILPTSFSVELHGKIVRWSIFNS